jgi:hypothetical protein
MSPPLAAFVLLPMGGGGADQHRLPSVHLHITTINNVGFADMIDGNGAFKPQMEWDGLMPDMIKWVARHAGFTYTLHSPTGEG